MVSPPALLITFMENIRFENITKIFGSIVANNNVSFSIDTGEVFCILGENGSGKTTLLNVLAGIYKQDEGRVYINGKEVNINSPKDAYAHKIGMVHQHFKLVNVFTAFENISLGSKTKYTVQQVVDLCNKYGFKLDPFKRVYDMSVSEKQTLEIVKTLFRGVDTLILDDISRSDTIPNNEVHNNTSYIEHEATVSKISEEQLFYLMSRGISEKDATQMIIMGFIEPFSRELPMEYAVELNQLIKMDMEGSVG